MAELKTRANAASVDAFLAGVADEGRRQDCRSLCELMRQITGCEPTMWGSSIVGFDSYHYKYASGHQGDSPVTGFSPRKTDLTLYIVAGFAQQEDLLARLGKHRLGKSCLYLKRLADVDRDLLAALVARSVQTIRSRYG